MSVYYNENDPYAAQWLRNLIAAGHLPAGHVDERSIIEVKPEDLAGYAQCHFFAGIGGWPLALRMAGWPDDRPVWTGSCPCQPFSGAGKQQGEKDKRHLWPEFLRLIVEWDVPTIFGEQVASSLGREWLVGVSADLEDLDYVVGAADLCAAGVGAPHIRQRLYWVADATEQGWRAQPQRPDLANGRPPTQPGRLRGTGGLADAGRAGDERGGRSGATHGAADGDQGERHQRQRSGPDLGHGGEPGGLADAHQGQRGRLADGQGRQRNGQATGRQQGHGVAAAGGVIGGLADADGGLARHGHVQSGRQYREQPQDGVADHGRVVDRLGDAGDAGLQARQREVLEGTGRREEGRAVAQSGLSHSSWSDCYVIPCSDGKTRRSGSGVQPLAHGVPNRVGRLRAYGNAIVAPLAKVFIEAYLDVGND